MGDHDTVLVRLRATLRADDPWTALYALHLLSTDRPGTLAGAVEELYRSDTDRTAFRPYLSWLLRSLGEPGEAVLLRLLATPELSGDDRRYLLRTAVVHGLRLPAELLRTYAQDAPASGGVNAGTGGSPAPELVDAMGLSGDPSFAPLLGALLEDPAAPRGRAALALGRLGARAWTAPIAGRLSEVTGLDHTAFTVALELMGDPAAVPHLLRWLAESGEERVYDVPTHSYGSPAATRSCRSGQTARRTRRPCAPPGPTAAPSARPQWCGTSLSSPAHGPGSLSTRARAGSG
ncbi:HEAT repeat domain-containing protein [Streptomyces virginiae]|uniref:HEAT repeat domain-containing protein n=1 Tax=Streptomyces virginiae TaxID=1961 RepID=UPI0036A18428